MRPIGPESTVDPAPAGAVLRRRPPLGVRGTFRIIRYFSIASLVCILAATLALAVHFRQVAIREIVQLGESANLALAEAALNAVQPQLLEFLDLAARAEPAELPGMALPEPLAREIAGLTGVRSVAKIKLYDRNGVVVYSTRRASIGRDQRDNAGFAAAMTGQVTSKLVYRDAFNPFDRQTEDDNLIQTYLPVIPESGSVPRGVFELYTDVNDLVAETERAQAQIIGGGVLIMALLYLALLMVVRYAARTISRQQSEIRDYALALERISGRILNSQEEEKRRIAFDLHEGVAQTLVAVKLHVEHAAAEVAGGNGGDGVQLHRMGQAVKDAIAEVRTLALNLRPSSLDMLGLTATITWFCRELARLHPGVEISHTLEVAEGDVPEGLKVIVYRVLEDACRALVRRPQVRTIRLVLTTGEETLTLVVGHDDAAPPNADDPSLAAAHERILLSGGGFEEDRDGAGWATLRATWLR